MTYVNFLRSLPLILVIFWFFFLIPILIGRENRVRETMEQVNLEGLNELIIHNASLSKKKSKIYR